MIKLWEFPTLYDHLEKDEPFWEPFQPFLGAREEVAKEIKRENENCVVLYYSRKQSILERENNQLSQMCWEFKSDDTRDIKVCIGLVQDDEFSLYINLR